MSEDIISSPSTGVALVGFSFGINTGSLEREDCEDINTFNFNVDDYLDKLSSHFNNLTVIVTCYWRWSIHVCAIIWMCNSDKCKANKSEVDSSFDNDDLIVIWWKRHWCFYLGTRILHTAEALEMTDNSSKKSQEIIDSSWVN